MQVTTMIAILGVAAFTSIAVSTVVGVEANNNNWVASCAQHRPLADCKADWNLLKQGK